VLEDRIKDPPDKENGVEAELKSTSVVVGVLVGVESVSVPNVTMDAACDWTAKAPRRM
jgi:hypothetical protein